MKLLLLPISILFVSSAFAGSFSPILRLELEKSYPKEAIRFEIIDVVRDILVVGKIKVNCLVRFYKNAEVIGDWNPKLVSIVGNQKKNQILNGYKTAFDYEQLCADFVAELENNYENFSSYKFDLKKKVDMDTKIHSILKVNLLYSEE